MKNAKKQAMTTQLNIGTEIKTVRHTDNSDIIKDVIITKCPKRNYSGMEVEFKSLKGKYKAYIYPNDVWAFVRQKGEMWLHEIK